MHQFFKLIIFIVLLTVNTIQAQTPVTLTWGKEYKLSAVKQSFNLGVHTFYDGTNTYIQRDAENDLFMFEKYDQNFNQVFAKEIAVPKIAGEKTALHAVVGIKEGKMKLITENKISNSNYTLNIFDLSANGVVSKESVALNDNLGTIRLFQENEPGSLNKNILVLSYKFGSPKKEDTKEIHYNNYSPETGKVMAGNFILPVTSDDGFELKGCVNDDQNNLYGYVRVLKEKELLQGSRDSKYCYKVFAYYPATNEVKILNLLSGSEFISSVGLKRISKEQLLVTGFYTAAGAKIMEGMFFTKIDLNSKAVLPVVKGKIDTKITEPYNTTKKTFKNDFVFKQINVASDGLISITAENVFLEWVSAGQPSSFYDHVYTIEADPSGNIRKIIDIPKYQCYYRPENFWSVIPFKQGDQYHYLYVDFPANLENADPKTFKTIQTYPNMINVLATADKQGAVTRKPFSSAQDKTLIKPACVIITEKGNEIIVYGEVGDIFKLGRLTY
jgi:hypothetical protein